MSKADTQRLKDARAKFTLGYEADEAQRKRDEEALRMYALDQWPDAVRKSRDAQPASGNIPATPARPCIVVDRLRQPVAQVVNQERESDLAVEIVAADDFGDLARPIDPSEIELREGLIRRIQRESESASARTWAFLRAAITGRGYYAINTRYTKGKTFDQEIYCRRLFDQSGVVLDPAHEEPDGSDAAWGFVFTTMSHDAYKAEYPRAAKGPNQHLDCDKAQWEALGKEAPGWFTFQGEQQYLRVAEYWHTTHTARTLCEMPDGSVQWEDKLPPDLPPEQAPRSTREVITKAIRWCKMDGCQVLDETDWPSPYVPIIKIVGNEIPPYDQQRRVDGIVNQSAIESQRGINYMASKLAEEVGLSMVPPLMVEEGTIEGYEAWYAQSNTRAFAYLPFKPTNLEGQQARAPFRPDKSVSVGPIAQGLQMFMEGVQTSTGVPDLQMGKPSRYAETYRGTQALIHQGERGTSNYMDNLERSVRYEGRIMDSLLYPIYGTRPGRLARIVDGEGEAETVLIGQPFTMQPNGQGQDLPVPAPPGATGQMDGVREYRLTEHANFNVAIKVTKGFDTRRQEEGAILGEMVTQQPQMMSVIGDLYFGSQDWPGAKEAKARWEVMLDPKVLALIEQQKGGQTPIPPQALQQMQQMQQQLQEVTQAATGMQQELQSRFQETQMKLQGEKEIAQIKAQAEIELANIKAMASIREAEIKAESADRHDLQRSESEMATQRLAHAQAVEQAAIEAALAAEASPEPEVI